jgi:uncharacterized integral membrane protein (TIGR00698 family)
MHAFLSRTAYIMNAVARLFPGVALCVAITLAARAIEAVETALAGQPYLEALVVAILLGVAVRAAWTPGPRWTPGIAFAAKILLEIAVMLLGAAVSAGTVLALGLPLIAGIVGIVAAALALTFAIGRALGLAPRLALLVACGNAICGNSAIAAVAPVIGADGDEIASSIAFTAVLGVVVVLALPLLVPLLALSLTQYGVLAGLTVYAVPQVLAATLPIGALSNQVGTVVKLVRVLTLGPVVLGVSLFAGRFRAGPRGGRTGTARLTFGQLVPWFIVGFLLVAAARSAGLIPGVVLAQVSRVAALLTTVAMAALGLGVDLRAVRTAGPRVTAAVIASLLVLTALSLGLIRLLAIP